MKIPAVAMACLLLILVTACAPPTPHTAIRVDPAAALPQEPLRVELTVAAEDGPIALELLDAAGPVLAHADAALVKGRAEVWLMPAGPESPAPMRLHAKQRVAGDWNTLATVLVPFDLDRPLTRGVFVSGVHASEDSTGGRFRWATDCATGEIENPDGDALVHLIYSCPAGLMDGAMLRLGGTIELPLPCPEDSITAVHVRVPRALWGASLLAPFEVLTGSPFRPIEATGSPDERVLAIRVFDLIATRAEVKSAH